MKLYYFVSCIVAAGSLVVFPELSLAHGGGDGGHGGGGGGVGVTDLAAPVLVVMVWAHPGQVSAGAALVRDLAGRVDLRVDNKLLKALRIG